MVSDLDVNGDFLNSAGTFVAPTNMNVAGNFSHTGGTFTAGTGTVTLDGVNQTISGSTAFYNLTKSDTNNNATSRTLTLASGTTQTITHALTLNGLDVDDRILLNGAASFDLTGSAALNAAYISIQDNTILDHSTDVSVTLPLNLPNSINLGGTTGWFTPTATTGGETTNPNTPTTAQIIIAEKEIQNAIVPIVSGGATTGSGGGFTVSDFSSTNLNTVTNDTGNSANQNSEESGTSNTTEGESEFTIVNSNVPIYISKSLFEVREGDLPEATEVQFSGDTIELI
jgi:hypothetical protein